jgi:DNA modification methylase
MSVRILIGDCRDRLRELPDKSAHCCVTSPPYFGLRDYGVEGQMGLELTPDEFVAGMVEVFREVRRVLRDDGTLWLNIGDSYAASGRGGNPPDSPHQKQATNRGSLVDAGMHEALRQAGQVGRAWVKPPPGLKQKDLIGIPWMLAFALRADGWFLRQDIIWSKPNPMPESVRDRCTKAHEYLFLLSKGPRYYYDQDATLETVSPNTHARLSQDVQNQIGSQRVPGKTNGNMKAVGRSSWNGSEFHKGKTAEHQLGRSSTNRKFDPAAGNKNNPSFDAAMAIMPEKRNRRTVWEVATQPFSEAHFATYPPALIEPCILAGCPKGGTVLDPFFGAGTTGLVADRLQRKCVGVELNPEYAEIAMRRIQSEAGIFADVSVETVGPKTKAAA